MKRWTLILACVAGCATPPPNPNPPNAPDSNDPAYTINGFATWYVVADAITAGHDELSLTVDAPGNTDVIDAYVGDMPPIRLDRGSDGFKLTVSIKDVPIGSYPLLLSANVSDTAFAKLTWNRSAPYYVAISTDYDFSDAGDISTGYMDMMHATHPELKITHFWAPYTYTDPMVTEDRRATLTTWIKAQHDTFGDEIGLHIHPYCNFVEDAGVTCVTDQSTVYPGGDTSGYTIKLAAYDRPTMGILLDHARDLFTARGLPSPMTFRAGGWTADLTTFQALNDKGFIADSSALNWARIEEWKRYELYKWTMEHWSSIGDTSQPYYPSQSDVLTSTPGSNMAMLEVPDNGVMIDYIDIPQVNTLFTENWDGTPLTVSHVLMSGFHPSQMLTSRDEMYLDAMLMLADANLASAGTGPVVYVTLSDLTRVFPPQ